MMPEIVPELIKRKYFDRHICGVRTIKIIPAVFAPLPKIRRYDYLFTNPTRPDKFEHRLFCPVNRPVTPEGLASISTISYVPDRPGPEIKVVRVERHLLKERLIKS